MSEQGQIRVGISGWRFDGWRGGFYPDDLPQRRELEFASRQLNSIELNGTFYSTQKPQSFQAWRKDTPDDFVFAIKGSQFITHVRKLENVEGALANFLAQGMLCLGKKLGPILWQLPPQTSFNAERIEQFLKLLPHTQKQAAAYAKQRDEWMAGRSWLEVEEDLPLRHAMESRHKSFATPEYIALLRKYGVALVVADSVKWPVMMDITADIIYCRLHGSEKLYPDGYTSDGDRYLGSTDDCMVARRRGDRRYKNPSGAGPRNALARCLRVFRRRQQGPSAVRRAEPEQEESRS